MYLVMELQTNNGTTASIINQYESLALAEQQYYLILSSAAVSTVEIHAAMLLNCTGIVLKNDFYTHSKDNT